VTQNKLAMEKKLEEESYARVTAVQNIKVEHFLQHSGVEGYFADRDTSHYFGCDRLLKIDTLYGRIQLGYNPSKGVSFIFANMKTSIYDTISERYQKEFKEYQAKRNIKGNNENVAFTSTMKNNSAVKIEKNENKPWTKRSIEPYLFRLNTSALIKTMPFLTIKQEVSNRNSDIKRKKEIENEIQTEINKGDFSEISTLRAEENEISHHKDKMNSSITRKTTASNLFFRKLNMAFDFQKHEMFEYYKDLREKNQVQDAENAVLDANNGEDDE